MGIDLADGSGSPVSTRLVARLVRDIECGRLPPGARLPAVRALAQDVGIAPNTVAKAYRELERRGYLDARGRAGTFVVDVLPRRPPEVERRLAESAAAFVRRAAQLGADPGETLESVRRVLRERRDGPPGGSPATA